MRTVNERVANLETVIRTGMDSVSKQIRCACPAIVQSWNATAQTVTVKLALKEIVLNGGAETEMEIPMLVDVPVVMPRAGGYCLLMTPQVGDECLVVFSDMCIDAWWQSGGIQSQAELRRHDLSDAFAIMGCWSQVKKPVFPSSGIRLQNDAGTAYVSIDSTGVHFEGADIGVEDLDSNENGVAVGRTSTATAEAKKFEVASDHDAVFYGNVSIGGSVTAENSTHTWTNLNASLSGVTVVEDVAITKIMGVCYLRGVVHLNSTLDIGSSGLDILTLPTAYRPTYAFNGLCAFYNSQNFSYEGSNSANAAKVLMNIDSQTGVVKVINKYPSVYGGTSYENHVLSLCQSWAL